MASDIPDWLQPFDGRDADMGAAAVLATVDAENWPHLSYLSAGEILARPQGISIALWPQARTCANIAQSGRAVLHVAADGAIWEARLALRARATAQADALAIFDGEILETRRHLAPYADVLSLVAYRLHDPKGTQDRWRRQHALLHGK